MAVETRSTTLAVPAESGRNRITLEPLREQGPDAITPAGIPNLDSVVFTSTHLLWDNLSHEVHARVADNLFDVYSADDGYQDLFPLSCIITEATFDFYFADSPTPRSVTIRPHDGTILERQSDAEIVHRWAALHGFVTSPIESPCGHHEQTMASA
jgi:hypothetical protein